MGDPDRASKGIGFGTELMQFAGALAARDHDALERARRLLLERGGPSVLVDAAGVAANFQRMVRIADATGIPVDDMMYEMGAEVRRELGLEVFPGAANSRRDPASD